MKIVIDKISFFLIIFFMTHGIGSTLFPLIIDDLEAALHLSKLTAGAAALIALAVDYIKFMLRDDSPLREDILDNDFVDVIPKETKENLKEATKELTNEEL